MRFACQSCGKAYNLPEEKIADKSNVKLKCRVCGAIVEVKKQGEVVAVILSEGDHKRGRVSEAPTPLTSMMPDDGDDATQAIAVGDQVLSENGSGEDAASALLGHVKSALAQSGIGPLPPAPPTGFGAAFSSLPSGAGLAPPPGPAPMPSGVGGPASGYAPTPVPPPLSVPELPRPEAPSPGAWPEPPQAPPLPSGESTAGMGSPPPPLPGSGADGLPHFGAPPAGLQGGAGVLQNGSNGAVSHFGDVVPLPDEPMAPVATASAVSAALSPAGAMGELGGYGGAPVELQAPVSSGDTTRKMLASLATGILIGFIIARLFF